MKQGCEDQSEQVLENVSGQNLRILAVASVALEILSKRFRSNVQVAQLSAFWTMVKRTFGLAPYKHGLDDLMDDHCLIQKLPGLTGDRAE